jgi:hypothetical protein
MKIEFYIEAALNPELEGQVSIARNLLEEEIENTVKDLGSDIRIFDRIIFAEKKKYGEAIKSIDKDEGFTDREHAVGFGKTIKQGEKSSIVYREEILNGIINYKDKTKLSINEELIFYVFRHEIGHAIDNKLRNPPNIKSELDFEIRKISSYYVEVFISEFAANWNSGNRTTKAFYNNLSLTKETNIKNHFNEIKTIKKSEDYRVNQKKYGVADRLWSILMELSQLLAISIKLNYRFKIDPSLISIDIQANLISICQELGLNYPNISKELLERIYLVWEKQYKKEYEI